jgi:hypothetical protein
VPSTKADAVFDAKVSVGFFSAMQLEPAARENVPITAPFEYALVINNDDVLTLTNLTHLEPANVLAVVLQDCSVPITLIISDIIR